MQWANISGEYRDAEDFMPLCQYHHRRYDRKEGVMEDLSSELPGDPITALTPTSQAGGNMMSSNRYAMTAPGSQPVDPLPPSKNQGDVAIESEKHQRTVLDPEASPGIGNPYPNTGGPSWVRSGNTTVKGS